MYALSMYKILEKFKRDFLSSCSSIFIKFAQILNRK